MLSRKHSSCTRLLSIVLCTADIPAVLVKQTQTKEKAEAIALEQRLLSAQSCRPSKRGAPKEKKSVGLRRETRSASFRNDLQTMQFGSHLPRHAEFHGLLFVGRACCNTTLSSLDWLGT